MKHMHFGLTSVLAALTSIASTPLVFAQGPLEPSGAPAPTMKTLEQVEPRTDVATFSGDASNEVVIASSGSYYLSGNLEVTNVTGITIAAVRVTLDLNGFGITRVSGSGGDGIRIPPGSDRATVRNGTIKGFDYGINSSIFPQPKSCLFEQLTVSDCSSYGIYAGLFSRILDCRVHDNAGSGIWANHSSTISGCTAHNNQGTYGIFSWNGSTISGCSAMENMGSGSSSYGIFEASGGSTIIGCTSGLNYNTNSPSTGSQGAGISVGFASTVKDCTASLNRGDGIVLSSGSHAEGNTSIGNGDSGGDGAGIHAKRPDARIDGNTVVSNDRGIQVDDVGNLIIRNSASGNGTNFVILASNKVGVIVSAPDSGAISGSTGGSGVGSVDPWANFSF